MMPTLSQFLRRLALLLALCLLAGAVTASPGRADVLQAPGSARLLAFHDAFLEMMTSSSMRKAREALRNAPSPSVAGAIVPADIRAAVAALPKAISNLQPRDSQQASAKALLEYWTSQPEYLTAAKAFVESQAWAVDTMVTEPLTGGALLSWAVQGLLERGSLSLDASFWGRIAAIAGTVATVAAVVLTCAATAVVGCVAAAALLTLAGGLTAVELIKEEEALAAQSDGAVAFTADCPFYNVCEIKKGNLTFSDRSLAMVTFHSRWTTVRTPAAEANSEADCYDNGSWHLGVTTPASASASAGCFTETTFAAGTRLYQSKENWYDVYYRTSAAAYSNFCSATSMGVEVIITWSNGRTAQGVATSNKPAGTC